MISGCYGSFSVVITCSSFNVLGFYQSCKDSEESDATLTRLVFKKILWNMAQLRLDISFLTQMCTRLPPWSQNLRRICGSFSFRPRPLYHLFLTFPRNDPDPNHPAPAIYFPFIIHIFAFPAPPQTDQIQKTRQPFRSIILKAFSFLMRQGTVYSMSGVSKFLMRKGAVVRF